MHILPMAAHEKRLRDALERSPTNWELRKQLAHLLYDEGSFLGAAEVIWETEAIPSIDMELAFAARILAKAAPRKAIRLLTALLEHNRDKAAQNLGMANALLHHGMVLQALRFYGAALEADPSLCNPDLEHFMLWIDDQETLWGDFKNRSTHLGELPWMKRDSKEAMKLTQEIRLHTTPIRLPGLSPTPGEQLTNPLYQQKAEFGANPCPPPAVTIPMDRVAPQHRRFDSKQGAVSNPWPSLQEMPEFQPDAPVHPEPVVTSFVVTPPPYVRSAAPASGSSPAPRSRTLQFPAPTKSTRLKLPMRPRLK